MNLTIEWAAGLFEGEGSAGVYRQTGRSTMRPRLSLAMTDEEPVREFARIMGVGRVHQQTKPSGKPEWRWQAQSWNDAQEAARRLMPFASPRRRQQLEAVLSARREISDGGRD